MMKNEKIYKINVRETPLDEHTITNVTLVRDKDSNIGLKVEGYTDDRPKSLQVVIWDEDTIKDVEVEYLQFVYDYVKRELQKAKEHAKKSELTQVVELCNVGDYLNFVLKTRENVI
jgi:hypothetical protein